MTKIEIRKYYFGLRNDISLETVVHSSRIITNYLTDILDDSTKSIHSFISIPDSKEIRTNDFIKYCWKNNISTATSITCFNPKRLEHTWINKKTTYKLGSFNVPEPTPYLPVDLNTLDLIIVPLLCFDLMGNRIGYGQGFYDSFLSQLPVQTKKIGVSLFEPLEENIPVDPWDVKLDGVVTTEGILYF